MKRSYAEVEPIRKAKRSTKNIDDVVSSINHHNDGGDKWLSKGLPNEKENSDKSVKVVEVMKIHKSKQDNDPWLKYESLFRFKMPKYVVQDIQNAVLYGLTAENCFNPRLKFKKFYNVRILNT